MPQLCTLVIQYIFLNPVYTASSCGNDGPLYCLEATKDVFMERGTRNYNNYQFLIFGKHPSYPKKRILMQFDDIPNKCERIASAKLYVRYWYSHKASGIKELININRTVQVHQV